MREFALGIIMALPLFGILLFLFRDLLINHYIEKFMLGRLADAQSNEVERVNLLKEDVITDILTSYRLLLTLSICLKTILKYNVLKDGERDVLTATLKEVNNGVVETEQFLSDNGFTEKSIEIKNEVLGRNKEKEPIKKSVF